MIIFAKLWAGIKWLFSLLLPIFSKASEIRKMGPALRWLLRVLVMVAILAGLTYLNYALGLERYLIAPWPFLRRIWLPLLFVLAYVLFLLFGWLLKLLHMEEDESEFPDIDAAWSDAVASLNEAGIDLSDAPLFLVLGQPAGGEEALLRASQLNLTVNQNTRRPNAPIHVSANRDGIYVTCSGASLTGRQAQILTEDLNEPVARTATPVARATPAAPKGPFAEMPSALSAALGMATATEAPPDAKKSGVVAPEPEPAQIRRSPRHHPRLLKMADEVDRLTARLQHLCRLILRDRSPYCPLNGVLLLIPYSALDADEDAHQTGAILQRDLAAAREVLKVHCPVFAIVCDLEQESGFREFLRRIPQELVSQRLGQQFPLAPDVEPEALPGVIESGAQWVCHTLVRIAIYKLLRGETGTSPAAVRGNARLFNFLCRLRDRSSRLARLLTRAVVTDTKGPPLLGGCFLAGTGKDAASEQAFVAGVFRLLLENQNYVSWTADALAEESWYQRVTKVGYIALTILSAAIVVTAYYFWPRL